MGKFGGFYKGENKKKKKKNLEEKGQKIVQKETFILPKIDIIKKGKDEE